MAIESGDPVKEEHEASREEPRKEKKQRAPVKSRLKTFLKKRWTVFVILIIILMGIYVRTLDYRWSYLRNIDSYMFLRQFNEIVQNGGVFPLFDPLMKVPEGEIRLPQLFPYQYLGAYSYMLTGIFLPGLELWRFLIYFPAVLASLMAIPMYFIGKALYDRRAGVLAAFFIVFDMAIISRTLGGDPDSDGIVLLIPLIAIAVFLYAYKYVDRVKKINKGFILYSVLLGLALFLWSQSWAGYSYVFWIIGGFIIIKLLADFMKTRRIKQVWNDSKHVIACMVIAFLIFATPIILFLEGPVKVLSGVMGPFQFLEIKGEEGRLYPNVGVSVAELQGAGGWGDIIKRTSAIQDPAIVLLISPFFLMVFAMMYLIYSYYKKRQHFDTLLLLLLWFLVPFFATTFAVRFSILFSAPLAIGSAILLAKIIRLSSGEDKAIED